MWTKAWTKHHRSQPLLVTDMDHACINSWRCSWVSIAMELVTSVKDCCSWRRCCSNANWCWSNISQSMVMEYLEKSKTPPRTYTQLKRQYRTATLWTKKPDTRQNIDDWKRPHNCRSKDSGDRNEPRIDCKWNSVSSAVVCEPDKNCRTTDGQTHFAQPIQL